MKLQITQEIDFIFIVRFPIEGIRVNWGRVMEGEVKEWKVVCEKGINVKGKRKGMGRDDIGRL